MVAISMYRDIRKQIEDTLTERKVDKDTKELTMTLVDSLVNHCQRVDQACLMLNHENNNLSMTIRKLKKELGIEE